MITPLRLPLLSLALTLTTALGLFPRTIQAMDFAERFEEIKKNATDEELYRFLYALPKGGDLHNHSGGANWPEWWYQTATDLKKTKGNSFYTRTKILNLPDSTEPLLYFITIPRWEYEKLSAERKKEYEPLEKLDAATKTKWLSSIWLDQPGEGRDEFFENIWPRLGGLLRDPYLSIELLVENMKQFGAEGLSYIETQNLVFGAPLFNFFNQEGQTISINDVAEIFRRHLAEKDVLATGVTVRFQTVVLRFTPVAEQGVEDAYAFMDKNRDLWVGINMAGREDNDKGYPARFLHVYRKMMAKYSDIGISIHAGEVDEPNSHIRDTLLLGATRIGHGNNIFTDPDIMFHMRTGKNLMECNLISNKLLEYIPDFSQHTFPQLLRFGIPVCLNTDDRGMWGSNMTDEYFVAVKNFNLTWPEIEQIGADSLRYSFAQPPVKTRLLNTYFQNLRRFTYKYNSATWKSALKNIDATGSPYAQREFKINLPLPSTN
jgi:adenosine deaminase CECR1